MKAGKLDRRVILQQPVETQNSVGEIVIAFQTFATVWAEVLPLNGREYFAAQQFVPEAQLKIFIRWITGVNEKFKVVHDDVAYDIMYIAEIGRREGIQLIVRRP